MFNFLSRGDLEVALDKYQFSPGDTVSGKVTLKLKKPTQANKITISVTGEKTITTNRSRGVGIGNGVSIGFGSQNSSSSMTNMPETQTEKIFSFELPLDGSKEYTEGEYPFSIKLPADIVQPQTPANIGGAAGAVAQVINAVSSMSGGTTVRTEWYVEAQLDIPGAIDMRKKVVINVG